MSKKCFLGRCVVNLKDEAPCVAWAADRLSDYLHENCGDSTEDVNTVIFVGPDAYDGSSESQDYRLWLAPGAPNIISAVGEGSLGTKFALIDLLREIRFEDGKAWIPSDLDRKESPDYRLRGMYAHLHWQYGHPYALRTWSLDDWKRYVDLLALMKVNLFQLWTMAAICPNPLSPRDEAYLLKLREVVRYARETHGMEVWPGECGANVAESDFGEPIETREYWQVEVLKNPAVPAEFRRIMENRANMYRTVNNADGYWVIDSDPGRFPESPASEFADIMAGNRELIDRHTTFGRDAKLIYWIWQSWGTGDVTQNWRQAIEGIAEKVHEPWWLLACRPEHLDLVKEMGLLEKTVFFPYALVEPEPSNPFTRVSYTEIADSLAMAAKYPGLRGAMGNAQTPLVQLPNIFRLMECAWDQRDCERSPEETLRELGRLIFPDIERELADGWLALSARNSESIFTAGSVLDRVVSTKSAGKPGPLGECLPDPMMIVRDLVLLLRIHAFAERLREGECEAIYGFLSQVLAWQRQTDFHGCRVDGVDFQGGGTLLYGPDYETVVTCVRSHEIDDPAAFADAFSTRLSKAGFDEAMCDRAVYEAIIQPLEQK